jgi:hypothetical protein
MVDSENNPHESDLVSVSERKNNYLMGSPHRPDHPGSPGKGITLMAAPLSQFSCFVAKRKIGP